jgi:ADP-heptose:LPS heptosyltransferase
MGDLLNAAPVILTELDAGSRVTLLVFPQVVGFVDLVDFGVNAGNLKICVLPVGGGLRDWRRFLREVSVASAQELRISPHAPAVVSSWKIPLILWFLKRRYWPQSRLIGADSERLAWLFDERVPVDRSLPYMEREWVTYRGCASGGELLEIPRVGFKQWIRSARRLPRLYDVVIHPGAGSDNRQWPVEAFGQLLACLPGDCRIMLVGLPRDVAAIQDALPRGRTLPALCGTLEEAIVSMARSRVALTMDSGSLFFARALHVPAVALFGPSDPANVVPSDWDVVPLYEPKWSCQPCRQPFCRQRSVLCMAALEPLRVAHEIRRLLDRPERAAE